MTTDEGSDKAETLRALRRRIAGIEAGTEDIAEAAATARAKAREKLDEEPEPPRWSGSNYPGMPEGDDWLDHLPPRYVDGQRGFELRLARDLAAVGVRCYTLSDLHNYAATDPQAVPVLVDWLKNLDRRIPGPETLHRRGLRSALLDHLTDPAAYGNQDAIETVIAQLRHDPPLDPVIQGFAGAALDRIAGPANYAEILELYRELSAGEPRAALLPYLGRSRTSEAVRIAVEELSDPATRQFAIQALILAEADGVLPLIARYTDDPNEQVRDWVKTAMEQLE